MIQLENLQLPDELVWVDETDWTPVAQNEEYFLAGSLGVQTSVKLSGRPMTLTRKNGEVWVSRALILSLMALAAEPGKEMTLTMHDGRVFRVMFRHSDGPPLIAEPVIEYNIPPEWAYYSLALHLFIINEVT